MFIVAQNDIVVLETNEYERMLNCVNCDHYDVCATVQKRKATKANDYSPCANWKLTEEDG